MYGSRKWASWLPESKVGLKFFYSFNYTGVKKIHIEKKNRLKLNS